MVSRHQPNLEGITSLAILKVNWDEGEKDYLENFMPFVAERLRQGPADEVSLPELQEALSAHIGLDVPQGVVRTLLKRAHKRGYVSVVSKVYLRDLGALGPSEMKRKTAEIQRKCQALIVELQRFAREQFGIEWNEDQADEALLGYVRSVAAPVVQAAQDGSPVRLQNGGRGSQHVDYVVSAFIQRLHAQDPTSFGYLEDVAKGCMLASVLYYEDPNAVVRKFEGVSVYFDTPLLLSAIGVNGPEMEAPCLELFALLQGQDVELRIFRHTVDEMQGVLDGHARRPRAERVIRIPTVGEPVQTRLSSSDLRLMADTLEDRLRRLGIRVEERPDFDRRYTLDERKLDDMLQAEINYVRDDTRTHDAEAVTAIHRLRRGRLPARLEQSQAVFVTTNSKLVRVSRAFFASQFGSRAFDAPHCILHDDLATRLWLKTPNAAPDLPRRQLIARSYAALLPEEGLIKRYLAEIERLRQNEMLMGGEYLYMRSADEAYRALADATLNDPDAFSEATVEEVRRRAQAEARAEAEERLRQEAEARRKAEAEAEAKRKELEAAVERADAEERSRLQREADLEKERGAAAGARDEAAKEAARTQKTVGHIKRLANSRARTVRGASRALIIGVLVVATALTAIKGLPQQLEGWLLYVFPLAALIVLIQAMASAVKQADSWSEKLALRVERHTLTKYLPPDEVSTDDETP